MDVWLEQDVSGGAPGLIGDGLNDGEGAGDYLDGVARRRIEQARLEVDGNYEFGAQFAHGGSGNLLRQEAVHQK